MKIALLNDTHFGVRNDSPAFVKYQNRFYDELFFPYLKDNNIDTLIHLGDVVDRRKFINHNTAHNFKKVFWDKLDELNIKTYIIIGNHDTYYKNTNEVNALQNLDISKNTEVFTKATELEFDGLKVLFIPWICDDNETESVETIKNSTSPIAMGHLEIKVLKCITATLMTTAKKRQCLKDLKKFCLVTFIKSQMTDKYTI